MTRYLRLLARFAAIATFAVLVSACSSGQPVTTGPADAPADLVPTDTEHLEPIQDPGDVMEDEDPRDVEEDSGDVMEDEDPGDWEQPDVQEDPLPVLPPPTVPEGQEQPNQTESAYCAAYRTLVDAGETDPTTPAEAEAMVLAMIQQAETVDANAPTQFAIGTQEVRRFLAAVAEKAAAEQWDPEWFMTMSEDEYALTDLDLEMLSSYFDASDEFCAGSRDSDIQVVPGTATPSEPPPPVAEESLGE